MMLGWILRVYSAFLRLYPGSFRAEFAHEMRDAFWLAAKEASNQGILRLGLFFLKEMLSLPASIVHVRTQMRPRRSSGRAHNFDSNLVEQPWKELLVALAVFILPASMVLTNQPAEEFSTIGPSGAALFLVVMLLVGWLGGFPLWSVPYVGVVLAIAGYLYVFQWVVDLVGPTLISNFSPGPWDRSTYMLLEIVSNGMMWLMLLCLTLLVVALLQLFNRFQSLLARIRHDWTLVSYILYGESIFALVLLLEDHRHDPNYVIASLFCLLAGVWLYLRSQARRERLLALLGCLSLAVGIAVSDTWPHSSSQGSWLVGPAGSSEIGGLLLAWISMVAALLLPGLLARLPSRPAGPTSHGPPEASG
jgi:hypothetical protein